MLLGAGNAPREALLDCVQGKGTDGFALYIVVGPPEIRAPCVAASRTSEGRGVLTVALAAFVETDLLGSGLCPWSHRLLLHKQM